MKKLVAAVAVLLLLALGVQWFRTPSFDPVAFEPPPAPPAFDVNEDLKDIEVLDLGGGVGPEDVAISPTGMVYTAMENGDILRLSADDRSVETFLNTGGRPLGLVFDHAGNLLVADPFVGLLRVAPDRTTEVLVPARSGAKKAPASNATLCYANNVDVAPDGIIYFTDSSERFCPPDHGGTFEASQRDIFEHQKTGRFLSYDPETKEVVVLARGFQFANGVAVSPDGKYALISETGDSRVQRYHLSGSRQGELETVVQGMAGYPDNLTRGLDGRYWIGFTRPRSELLERVSGSPALRQVMSLLPASLRPVPAPYGHIVAIDIDGNVVARHLDPEPHYPDTTGATETDRGLYVHSLHARGLGWLPRTGVSK